MKKFLVFAGGFFAGAAATLALGAYVNADEKNESGGGQIDPGEAELGTFEGTWPTP